MKEEHIKLERMEQLTKTEIERSRRYNEMLRIHVSNTLLDSYQIPIIIPLNLHFNWNESNHMQVNKQL
jgi:hypothetical protein